MWVFYIPLIYNVKQNILEYMARLTFYPFKRWIKSHLPFAGIIRSSPYSPR